MKNCQFQTGLPHYFKFTLILSMGNSETETEGVFVNGLIFVRP